LYALLYTLQKRIPSLPVLRSDGVDPDSQNTDIWIYDLETQNAKRLTFDPSIDSLPVWSPDEVECCLVRIMGSLSTCF
jgi:hypothetical protein